MCTPEETTKFVKFCWNFCFYTQRNFKQTEVTQNQSLLINEWHENDWAKLFLSKQTAFVMTYLKIVPYCEVKKSCNFSSLMRLIRWFAVMIFHYWGIYWRSNLRDVLEHVFKQNFNLLFQSENCSFVNNYHLTVLNNYHLSVRYI